MTKSVQSPLTLVNGVKHISKRLVLSYLIDWILILATAAVGGGFSRIKGSKHAFSLNDSAISFPHKPDTVSVGVLIIVSLVAPGVITALISLIVVPGPTADRKTSKSLIWRRRVWEWNTAWMGLGVALAGAFVVTEGMKDIYGKPRPDLLARCNPDLGNIAAFQVGGLSQELPNAPVVVTSGICRTTGSTLNDGFASFPSGHSSFAWAGMTYLALFLCSKFAIAIPFLSPARFGSFDHSQHKIAAYAGPNTDQNAHSETAAVPSRNQAAAPPVHLLILVLVPIGTAIFISGSRWFDYRHHGFDIIFGSLIGFSFAWLGFRWYHLPIRRGAGWSWGARSRERAFYTGLGILTYVGNEGWSSATATINQDLESQATVLGAGRTDRPETEMVRDGQNTASSSSHSELSK
ncbi:MAG: hypothetical protein Q9160_007933 [Pyrenula sp. 1 TL-2023]